MSSGLKKYAYNKGLHDLGNGCYAYLQPDGGWGWSNAGLIVDEGESLLVDTLFDVPLTRAMLETMRKAEPKAANHIRTLVNTHHNGDHCYGNQCCEGAEIIAHKLAAEAMKEEPPEILAGFLKVAPDLGELGQFLIHCFGQFDFESVTQTLPTTTFETELTRQVGNKTVTMQYVGPAHSPGDVLVHVPGDKTVFTGDILFIEGHPVMWEGPTANWVQACDTIMQMDVETVVPGHGPITDKKGVAAVREYLLYVRTESKKRFDAGMNAFEAAQDIDMGPFRDWGDAERIAINVATVYRELSAEEERPDVATLFTRMAQLAKKQTAAQTG